jgi:hypothetical protein
VAARRDFADGVLRTHALVYVTRVSEAAGHACGTLRHRRAGAIESEERQDVQPAKQMSVPIVGGQETVVLDGIRLALWSMVETGIVF